VKAARTGVRSVPVLTNLTPCCRRPLHLDHVASEDADGNRTVDDAALIFAVNLHLATCRGR
jgi:hypothetical protein